MRQISYGALVLVLAGLLASCGGGGSNSGGDGLDGTYTGVADVIYSARGDSEREKIQITATISGSKITITDAARSRSGALDGRKYSVPFHFDETYASGVSCQWRPSFRGEVLSALIQGIINGSASCSNGVVISVSGSYELVKQAVTARAAISGEIGSDSF